MDSFLESLYIEERFFNKVTYILGFLFIGTCIVGFEAFLKDFLPIYVRIPLYFVALVSWGFGWIHFYKKLPKATEGKNGIVLFITTRSQKTRERLETDLVEKFQKLINENQLSDITEIILAKNYQSQRLLPLFKAAREEINKNKDKPRSLTLEAPITKEYFKMHNKVRGVFYVWGSIDERSSKGKNQYVINLNANVMHRELELSYKEQLTRAFRQIWIESVLISQENEWEEFEVIARYYYLAIRYLVGIALLFSGASLGAQRLHESIEQELGIVHFPNKDIILSELKRFLSTELLIAGIEGFGANDIPKARTSLNKAIQKNPNNVSAYLMRAVIELEVDDNPKKSLATAKEAGQVSGNDWTWKYSAGFLHMHMNAFDNALTYYDEIARYTFEGEAETVAQVIGFNERYLESHPSNIQSRFILGFVHYVKEHNLPMALENFEKFLDQADDRKHRSLIMRAKKYKSDIQREMRLK